MEDDNQLSEEDLAKKMEIESFEDSIWTEINKMKDEGLKEDTFNNMLFNLKETGEVEISLPEIKGPNYTIPKTTIATVHDIQGIRYFPDKIKEYNKICKAYEIEANLPEGLPDLETLKERQGDDQKVPEEKEENKEPQENEEIKDENEESKDEDEKEEDKQQDDNNEKKRVYKHLPKNSVEINPNRRVDEHNTVHEELEKATGEKAERFHVAPVGNKNNLDNKVFAENNGEFKEIELPESRGKNPTDSVMRMREENTTIETPDTVIDVGDRELFVFDGGPYPEVDIGNRNQNGEFSSVNVEEKINQGRVGNPSRELREAGGNTLNARLSSEEKRKVSEAMDKLEAKGVPNELNPAKDEDGKSLKELNSGIDATRKVFQEKIEKMLINNGTRYTDAEKIAESTVKKVLDEEKEYSIALDEAKEEYDNEQKTPGDPPLGSRW